MTQSPPPPRVSIGLPVYNGERYLTETLESLCAQTFEEFEVIIVDNDSTDGTIAIAERFAREDSRVVVHRNSENIGAPANYNRTFELSRGEFFKWAAHDDRVSPELLARCVETLDSDPGLAMCHTHVRVIDESGRPMRDYDVELPNLESPAAAERFADMALVPHACYDAFGVTRTAILRHTPLIGAYLGSDRCLLAEIALHGRIRILPEILYENREHQSRSVRIPTHERARMWFHQGHDRSLIFPAWRMLAEYRQAIRRAPLSRAERKACRSVLRSWMARNWHLLRGDLRIAAKDLVRFSRPLRASSEETTT